MLSGSAEDQEGFMVSDGHLSDEEYNFSYDSGKCEVDKKAEIELRRQRYRENQKQNTPILNQGKPFILTPATADLDSFKAMCF